MDWTEISVPVNAETAEPVSALLSRFGSVAIEEVRATPTSGDSTPPVTTVRCYLLAAEAKRHQREIESSLWHLSQIMPIGQPSFRSLTERDWTEAWKEYYPVLHVGRRIVIVPTWRQYQPQPEEITISMNPGMAFGTGLHPSTQLCLAALEEQLQPGSTVLDVGTGTGILSIAAVKLGASHALALDIDPASVQAASENAALNQVSDKVKVERGSVIASDDHRGSPAPVISTGGFDLTVANIIAEVIAAMADALCRLTRPGGAIITAGIIQEREHLVTEAFAANATLVERKVEGDWVCLCYRNQPGT
jgi:ribosomal protein L11 methyltransferase